MTKSQPWPGDPAFCTVDTCRGAAGCPRALADVSQAAREVAAVLEDMEVSSIVAQKAGGEVRQHGRFRVAVAGCPNACSRPQIVDFGLIAVRGPLAVTDRCTGCGSCLPACREGAVRQASVAGNAPEETLIGRPEFHADDCVACGECIGDCPEDAIVAEEGWRVVAGGRLGRHPALAREVRRAVTLEESMAALGEVVEVWRDRGMPGERVGATLDRVGVTPDRVGL